MACYSSPYSERNTVEKCLERLSESVFVGLCKIVGTSEVVSMRRDVVDIKEIIYNEENTKRGVIEMVSGSFREGFRLWGSDQDYMFWHHNHQVIWDESLLQYYNEQNQTLIVSDNSESPPGFTLLWLPKNHIKHKSILSSCVIMKNKLYISSLKYKQTMPSYIIRNPIIHGPCKSGSFRGIKEYDEAQTFQSRSWPPSASSWVSRFRTWPKPHVVRDIVRKGCHFVAIGHSLGNHVDNEWRISFSLAEKELVYSMNHCQFLIYGLLKLFLKDVINNDLNSEDKILCSYHMKTAVFWAIQQNKISHWSPQNLLQLFWVCFKLILKWVYEGVCPNFFIPENNMFLSKVNGDSQTILFLRLYTLYERGVVSCLLHCSSIRAYVLNVLYNPRLTVSIDEHMMIPEFIFDQLISREIYMNVFLKSSNLHAVEKLIKLPLTQYQVAALQNHTTCVLLNTAFILHNMYIGRGGNRQRYITDKISCNMLKLVANTGCISDALYLAMYYYKTSRYTEALSIIEMAKVKLSQPHVMDIRDPILGDRDKYAKVVGGKSWSTKMREAIAGLIILHKDIGYINELLIEQSVIRHRLCISPFVLIYMLEILCYIHVDSTRVQTALNDFRTRIENNFVEGIGIGDISWHILGICYYMTGNFKAAFNAYQNSLKQIPINQIQTATIIRIIILIYQFFK